MKAPVVKSPRWLKQQQEGLAAQSELLGLDPACFDLGMQEFKAAEVCIIGRV